MLEREELSSWQSSCCTSKVDSSTSATASLHDLLKTAVLSHLRKGIAWYQAPFTSP